MYQLWQRISDRLRELLTESERAVYAHFLRELARGARPHWVPELAAVAKKIEADPQLAAWGVRVRSLVEAIAGYDPGVLPPLPHP